jgi:hypothetical protein
MIAVILLLRVVPTENLTNFCLSLVACELNIVILRYTYFGLH